jgi:hypothetical protein
MHAIITWIMVIVGERERGSDKFLCTRMLYVHDSWVSHIAMVLRLSDADVGNVFGLTGV